ncbi:MAG: BtaA family protein [Planctomycetaceae bacterium]|nr:BtaA family protein [Planctomycetaceae bacterium]
MQGLRGLPVVAAEIMVGERLSRTWFRFVHGRNIVYNQCWEDPRLDRVALQLTPQDRVVVITSAGCNALDYALAGAGHVHAVDMNPRQNALLQLKLTAAKHLDHGQFFQMFGRGKVPDWKNLYTQLLRPNLDPEIRAFWDRKGDMFAGRGRRKSFYFRGTSGTFAWMVNYYIDKVARLRDSVNALLAADSVEQQQDIFQQYKMSERLWRPMIRWVMRRDMTLAMLGVPRSQRRHIDDSYPGGILQFVIDRVEAVFTRLPLKDNYFWRVYLSGEYTPDCCPEYLRPENFHELRTSVQERVTTHTSSVLAFVEQHPGEITRFVLLDHMDWLTREPTKKTLTAEWQAIVTKSAPNARILWRSADLNGEFVNSLQVQVNGTQKSVGDLLVYNRPLAEDLHRQDRVHTYGSFCIADLQR